MITGEAFEVLGIEPTEDGRAVRAAFLRLAKIYHPDRFADSPDDVRSEAERRMKEATTAYEVLRNRKAPPVPDIDDEEIERRAHKYREDIKKKKAAEEKDRARWRRWDEVERVARETARREADIASRIADEVHGKHAAKPEDPKPATPLKSGSNGTVKTSNTRDPLGERLDAARRGVRDPLVKRS